MARRLWCEEQGLLEALTPLAGYSEVLLHQTLHKCPHRRNRQGPVEYAAEGKDTKLARIATQHPTMCTRLTMHVSL